MNLQKIEQLIGKYDKGETTVEEEQLLKAFFMNEDIPLHLKSYKTLFSYYNSSKNKELPSQDFDEKALVAINNNIIIPMASGSRNRMYFIAAIAAGILILMGIYFRYGMNVSTLKDTYDDPVLAYAETKKILMKVSSSLNSGVNEMKTIKEFNNGLNELEKVTAFQTGLDHLEKVTIFDKAKEIITTKK